MRENFGAKPWIYPRSVFMIATYGEEGTPEVLMWDRTRITRNDYGGKLTITGHPPIANATI